MKNFMSHTCKQFLDAPMFVSYKGNKEINIYTVKIKNKCVAI
jgi:hypothetical protein